MPSGDAPGPGGTGALRAWLRADPRHRKCALGVLIGLGVYLLILPLWFAGGLDWLEHYALDARTTMWLEPGTSDPNLVLIQVDDESLDHIRATGQAWPPRRALWGSVVSYCRRGGAKAMVLDVTFAEPSAYTIFERDVVAEEETDDAIFAANLRSAGQAYLGVTLATPGRENAHGMLKEPPALPLEIQCAPEAADPPAYVGITPPVEPIRSAVAGLGNVIIASDADGVVRGYHPIVRINGKPFPSLGTLVAAHVMGAKTLSIGHRSLRLGEREIRLDHRGRINLRFHGPWEGAANQLRRPYPYTNLKTILESILVEARNQDLPMEERQPVPFPAEMFRDRVVFLGYTAADLGDIHTLPTGPLKPGVLVHMTAVDNLLHGDPLRHNKLGWAIFGVLLACLVTALSVSYPSSWRGPTLGFIVLALLVAAATGLYGMSLLWIDFAPMFFGILGTMSFCLAAHYILEYRQRRQIRGMLSVYLAPQAVAYFERHPEKLVLGGETREATMFFSDLAGFTSISEGLGPAKLVEIMNDYLGRVTNVILEHEGTVDKYIGDAVVAFWNAPIDQPDHALRACHAAIDSQAAMLELRRQYPMLNMRVGLNSGVVTVGNMGCASKFNYTVMGDAVNLASRLEGANKNYDTLTMIGEDTYRHVVGKVVARELDLLRVKGKDKPVRVYELVGRPGEVSDTRRQVLLRYENGLTAYRERRWAEAIQQFQSAVDLDPEDGPARLYLERCNGYLTDPPEPDWDGVTTLTTK